MKSSLPQIFRNDLKIFQKPVKQTSQFSLYLRTNLFRRQESNVGQNRYHKGSLNRANKSMELALRDSKQFNLSDDIKGKDSLKNFLSQRKSIRSKSMFIEEKNNQKIEQVDSFKSIRKRVLEELRMIEKSIPIVSKLQSSIRTGMDEFKVQYMQQLVIFETEMRKKIQNLMNCFKSLRKQIKIQVKVNKDQLNFLDEQLSTYKQIAEGFAQKQSMFIFQITQGNSGSTKIN